MAGVAARSGVPYVCVPAGTRNHFALDLGLDREDVVGALDAFAAATERRIDLASVNGRTFVNNASLGLYASMTESAQYRDAKLRTAAAVLPDLLGPDAEPLDLSFTGPDGTSYPGAQMILVSNNPYQLAHAGGRGSRKRIDGGVLGIVTVRIDNAGEAAQFAALQAAGQTRRFAGWLEWSARSFEIRSPAWSSSAWTARPWRWTRRWPSSPSRERCACGCRCTRSACHPPPGRCGSWPAPPPWTSPSSRSAGRRRGDSPVGSGPLAGTMTDRTSALSIGMVTSGTTVLVPRNARSFWRG